MRELGYIGSLTEFKRLTYGQLILFLRDIRQEAENRLLEAKMNARTAKAWDEAGGEWHGQ